MKRQKRRRGGFVQVPIMYLMLTFAKILVICMLVYAFPSAGICVSPKTLKVKFPDGWSAGFTKSKPLKESYIVKDGTRHRIEYHDEWINPRTGKLQSFIMDGKILHVIKTPVKGQTVKKEFYNGSVTDKNDIRIPIPDSDDRILYDELPDISRSRYQADFSLLTPEVSPEVSVTDSTNSGNSIILTDDIEYEFFLQLKVNPDISSRVFVKNIVWEFSNADFSMTESGGVIRIDPLRIPNLFSSDRYQWKLNIRTEISIRSEKGFYRDYSLEKSWNLWIIDRIRPEFDIDIQNTHKVKYKCSEIIDIGNIEISDNNINIPDTLSSYKVQILTLPEESGVKIMKTRSNVEVTKYIDGERFFSSYSYFDIPLEVKCAISRNYQGPFQMCLKMGDMTNVYTYEVFSGHIEDDIPPSCEVNLSGKSVIGKNDFDSRLMKKKLVFNRVFPELITKKRYRISFRFYDNLKYISDNGTDIDQIDHIKSVYLNDSRIELNHEQSFSTHIVMSKRKRIKLKIVDKNNNIRIVIINLSASSSEMSITNLQE